MSTSGSAILVSPSLRGRWVVRVEGETDPVSEHDDANGATRAAERFARDRGDAEVYLVDR
jgi:hypothetical protein